MGGNNNESAVEVGGESANEDQIDGESVRKSAGGRDSGIGWLLMAVVGTPLMYFVPVLYESWGDATLVSSVPIGVIRGMSAAQKPANLVIETDAGFFPVREPAAALKGVSLVLETRRSGNRFICDTNRVLCVKTVSETLGESK